MRTSRLACAALLAIQIACSSSPSRISKPAGENQASPNVTQDKPFSAQPSACAVFEERWKKDMLGDEERELSDEERAQLEEMKSGMVCPLRLDIDGDGLADRVSPRTIGDRLTIEIVTATGARRMLGSGEQILNGEIGEVGRVPYEDDFSWVQDWDIAERRVDASGNAELFHKRSFAIPDAIGDGVFLSSSDVATILYQSSRGFELLELGF